MLVKRHSNLLMSFSKFFLILIAILGFAFSDSLPQLFYKKEIFLNKFFLIRLDKNEKKKFKIIKKNEDHLKTITEYTDDEEYLLFLKALKIGKTIVKIKDSQHTHCYYIDVLSKNNNTQESTNFVKRGYSKEKYSHLIDMYQQGKEFYKKLEIEKSLQRLLAYCEGYKNLGLLESNDVNTQLFADAIFTIAEGYFDDSPAFDYEQAYHFYYQYTELFPNYPKAIEAKKKIIYIEKNFLL